MTQNDENHAGALDVLTRDAGLGEMKDGTTSPADRRWAKDLVTSYQSKIAEARRALLPLAPPIKKAAPIRSSLLALMRDALVAQFTALTEALGPNVQYANRDLEILSDDDLRRLIQLIEPPTAE